jgi:hypothetical protein
MPPVAIAAVGAAASYGAMVAAEVVVFSYTALAATVAISAALAGASMLLAPDAPDLAAMAQDRTHTVRQPVSPRTVVYGQQRLGGPIVYLNVHGDLGPDGLETGVNRNKWLNIVIPLASHEVDSIGDVYFGEEKLVLGADGFVDSGSFYFDGDWGGSGPWSAMWERGMARVRKYTGAPGQVADQQLINETAHLPAADRWTAECIGTGVAYIICTLEWNPKIFQSGIPNITAVVRGKKVYDPRDGVTRYSDNAALCIRDFLAMPTKDGGVGATTAELLETNWIAQANLCDEAIPLAAGGFEPRYTLNGTVELSASNAPKATLEAMLTSCGGNLSYSGGKWRLLAGAYRSPTVTLTDDDFRGPLQIQTRASRRDSFNCVKGTFVSPVNLWQPADFPPVISDAFIAEDGGYQTFRELDMPFTHSAATAQRLAKMDLLKSRQAIVVSAQCKLTAFRCQVGDTILVTRERQGWTAKPFEVIEWKLALDPDSGLGVDLVLKETDASIFDFNTSEEQVVDPAPNTHLADWRNVGEVANLSVDSTNSMVVEASDGGLVSRAMVTWTAPGNALVADYEVQWRLHGDTVWPYSAVTTSVSFAIDSLMVGVHIDVRVRARNSLGVYGNYTTILDHTISGYSARPNPAVVNLKIQGSAPGSPGVFNTYDATFVWDASSVGPTLFAAYVVEIRDSVTNALRRRVEVQNSTYTYSYSDNQTDNLTRTFVISVQVRNRLGALSTATTLTATNPGPGLPTAVLLEGNFRTISLRYVPPTDPDWAGLLVWRNETTGFTPNSASLVYDGPDTFIALPGESGKTYYIRYAAYDAFSKDGLTISAEQVVKTVRIDHADLVNEAINSTHLYSDLNRRIEKAEYTGVALLDLAVVVDANSDRGRAAILTERTARATETESLARSVDALVVGLDGNNALIIEERTTRATETEALAQSVDFLTATTTSQTAALLTESIVRANAVQTLSQTTQTLSTTVAGNTTSIQTQAQSIDGISGQYFVKVDVGGFVSGFGTAATLKDGVPTSSFQVHADSFIVAKPGSGMEDPVVPFVINTSKSPPVLSFAGYASIDRLLTGTLDTEVLYVGGANVVIDGPTRQMRVSNGTADLVKLGKLTSSPDSYGIEIKDAAGNLVLSSGSGLGEGSVKALHLAHGISGNLLHNADFGTGTLSGWFWSGYYGANPLEFSVGIDHPDGWRPLPAHAPYAWQDLAEPTRWIDLVSDPVPCSPGERFECSVYTGAHRCNVYPLLSFLDAAGAHISHGSPSTTVANNNEVAGGNGLASFKRTWTFATAPTGTVQCRMIVRKDGSLAGNSNSFFSLALCYMGRASTNQTEPSPWSVGTRQATASTTTGLGTLATLNSVSTGQVTGLGSLATQNDINWSAVLSKPAFTDFATLSQINSSNASTFIAAAAIGSAHISSLSADKIAAGTLSTSTFLAAANTVVLDGGNGGRLYIQHPTTFALKAYLGHLPGVDYGFWMWDNSGNEVIGTSGVTGTFIKDATIGTLKIGANQITVPVAASLPSTLVGVNSSTIFSAVLWISIYLSEPGVLLVSASLSQSYSSITGFESYIYIDTVLASVRHAGDQSYNEAPSMIVSKSVAAGWHSVELRWCGHSSGIHLDAADMFVLGAMR